MVQNGQKWPNMKNPKIEMGHILNPYDKKNAKNARTQRGWVKYTPENAKKGQKHQNSYFSQNARLVFLFLAKTP